MSPKRFDFDIGWYAAEVQLLAEIAAWRPIIGWVTWILCKICMDIINMTPAQEAEANA